MACGPIPSKSRPTVRIDMYAEVVGPGHCVGLFTREQAMRFSREIWKAAEAIAE